VTTIPKIQIGGAASKPESVALAIADRSAGKGEDPHGSTDQAAKSPRRAFAAIRIVSALSQNSESLAG
jgi:hypothetical protein